MKHVTAPKKSICSSMLLIDSLGKYYPKSDAYKIERRWLKSYSKQVGYYADLGNGILARGEENTPFPPYPLVAFPNATARCILGGNCYHRVYKTDDTSTSK
jgi:hypothetical protein